MGEVANRQGYGRLWELDFLRGLAVISMVGLHLVLDWYFISGTSELLPKQLYIWQRITAGLFLILVGVSLSLYRSKRLAAGVPLAPAIFKRGCTIFGWGLAISLVTKLAIHEGYIGFGVLHLIGSATILSLPFLGLGDWNLPLGLAIIAAGNWLATFRFPFGSLFWLGLIPDNYSALDYFPLLPWFGVVLIGIFLGDALYPGSVPRYTINPTPEALLVDAGCRIGRHSLLIYLIHQPVLIGLLYGLKAFLGNP